MKFKGIEHIGLTVTDLKAAETFFINALGASGSTVSFPLMSQLKPWMVRACTRLTVFRLICASSAWQCYGWATVPT